MTASGAISVPAVAEMQGIYGAFIFSEKLLQKLWLRGEFDRHTMRTVTGVQVKVVHPGKWNLLGGPDFLGARLRFGDGSVVSGDVEVHLREGDWNAHGHVMDPAYAGVILHVVLFPPDKAQSTQGAGNRAIPVIALLPLLHRSLEEYAADEVVEMLANRPYGKIAEVLGPLPVAEITRILTKHSHRRWAEKVRFAKMRVERLGWDGACHHTAMEVFGYRFNRAPMLRCAARWPLAAWGNGSVDAEAAVRAESGHWSLQGVRPANHPLRRLRQYADWVKRRPDWPDLLHDMAADFEFGDVEHLSTRAVRRRSRTGELRGRIFETIVAGSLGGTRLDNLICDGILPLLAAETGRELHGAWHHWFVGDRPSFIAAGLRQLCLHQGGADAMCHGQVQGLLGWLLECESLAASFHYSGPAP